MPLRLISATGDQSFDLREGATLVVGRGAGTDCTVIDPTISRRHAEVTCAGGAVHVRDLGSSNGTFIDGARIESAALAAGQTVMFGKVPFRLEHTPDAEPASPSIVRERRLTPPGGGSGGGLSTVFRAANLADVKAQAAAADAQAVTEKKLALLLEVSKQLSRTTDVDALLDTIVGVVFQILDVDRVAIELIDDAGARTIHIARDRRGDAAGRPIPQSIARRVVEEKVAVVTDNATEDTRFGGQSILMQSIRSAICAPLVGSEDRVQGVLYVDNSVATRRFGDDDLDFLVAFSNIAAVAIENSRFAERIRRESLVRSNFERFFAPNLAARIAASPDAVTLGGEKRTVAVLFSDIRGFTALSEELKPDDVARLLTEYFTVMVEIVFRRAGTLDKFIGDAIMAQWGAPIGGPGDADQAMGAALDMMRELQTLNAKWRAEGRPPLQIGIGLNYGESFAGYIGSDRRLEYTVIGDAVNTASRLCAAAEGGEILLTRELRDALTAPPPMVERGTMELKGKAQSIPVFSVVP